MSKSTPRVHRFLKRQRERGKKPHVVWLGPEALQQLKRIGGKTIGDRIERLVLSTAFADDGLSDRTKRENPAPEDMSGIYIHTGVDCRSGHGGEVLS